MAFNCTFAETDKSYYFCLSGDDQQHGTTGVMHVGSDPWLHVKTRQSDDSKATYMPLPAQATIIGVLLVLSALFSGLNFGLLSLDETELEIIMKVGTEREKYYARKIYPVRRQGNYLLCTLLFGNVMANTGISILLGDLTSGMISMVASSFAIVIFGEIVPQTACRRYGLGKYSTLPYGLISYDSSALAFSRRCVYGLHHVVLHDRDSAVILANQQDPGLRLGRRGGRRLQSRAAVGADPRVVRKRNRAAQLRRDEDRHGRFGFGQEGGRRRHDEDIRCLHALVGLDTRQRQARKKSGGAVSRGYPSTNQTTLTTSLPSST